MNKYEHLDQFREKDDVDELIEDFFKSKVSKREFISNAMAIGLSLSSIGAFMASVGAPEKAFAAPPSGKPADITVGFFPSWIGGWSGVIVKHKEFWKNYIPKGSKVTWDVQVVGPPIVTNLLADKNQIGYMGDTPAIVSSTKRDIADLRMVACNLFSRTGQMCAIMMVHKSAPEFKDFHEFLKWLDGKKIAASGKGSCGDRLVTALLKKGNITADVQFLSPTIVKTALMSKKVDAIQAFQPHVAQIEDKGIGRVAVTGSVFDSKDADFIVMRKDFIDANYAAAKGWVKADIEGGKYIMSNPYETVKFVGAELPGFSTKSLWKAIYGAYNPSVGGQEENCIIPMAFDKGVREFIDFNFNFLKEKRTIIIDKLPEGAIYTKLVDEAAKEMGAKLPLGIIKGKPDSAYKG